MPERRSKTQRCQSHEELLEFFRSAWSKWFPVVIGDHGQNLVISLWPGDKVTTSGVVALQLTLPQKIPNAKMCWKILALIFTDQGGILLINYLPKGQTISAEYYSSLLVQLKDILHNNARLTGHSQPRRKWPTWASIVLISTLFSRSGPVGLPPVPWAEKAVQSLSFFVRRGVHCCRRDLVGRTNFWNFFEWLAKVRATG